MKQEIWHDALVARVVDGDTLLLDVFLGYNVHVDVRARLHEVFAPETYTAEGKALKQRVADWLTGEAVEVRHVGVDRYGRTLAEVRLPDGGKSVNDVISEWIGTPKGAGVKP